MKKIFLIPTLILTLFFTINKVNADTINYTYTYTFPMVESQVVQVIEDAKSEFVNHWRDDYSSEYPYYFLSFNLSPLNDYSNATTIYLYLYYSNSSDFGLSFVSNDSQNGAYISGNMKRGFFYKSIYCSSNPCSSTFEERPPSNQNNYWYYSPFFNTTSYYYSPFNLYYSNTPIYNNSVNTLNVVKDNEILFSVQPNAVIPTYTDEFNVSDTFTEINLNNYDSVILSLKDYTNRPSFNTTILTLGQLCLTPVYNYGMTNKSDLYSGYQVQSCSPVYNEYTSVSVSILQSDIQNHSIYYLKAYNLSISNKVKVDPTIFNITYITSSNSSNPSVTIGGRSYPVIPYSDLSSSATSSTTDGYISGGSCAIGDINCQSQYAGADFSDLFTHPLQLLQTLWSSITGIFALITTFITILPSTLQSFLYLAFMLGIVLGVIKILIG